jgi:hypothetical protein
MIGESELAPYHYDSPRIHDGAFAERLHRQFQEAIKDSRLNAWKFDTWILYDYDPVNVNCIAWHGDEMKLLVTSVGIRKDEEFFLAHVWPKVFGRPNVIFGRKLCAHYAFRDQRPALDGTDILERYDILS